MKDRLSAWMIVSLIVTAGFLGFIVFESDVVSGSPITWYVDDVAGSSGPGDPDENFTSIQDAINASSDGDIVYVYNGTYYENIVVNRSINVTGMDKSNTTIDGGGVGEVVLVVSSWVNITGFTITNGTVGVHVSSTSNNNISDNNVSWNIWEGIWLDTDSNNNLVMNNTVSSNGGCGITTYSSIYNNITKNNLTNDGVFVWGDQLSHFNTHTIPDDNIVNGEPLYYYKNSSGVNIDGIPVGQLILANCTYFNVSSLEINRTDIAVELAYSQYVNITDNNLTFNSWKSILLYSSNNNNITDNNVTFAGEDGMVFWNSNWNNITGNNVTFNEWAGILFKGSQWNYIADNNISFNNEDGIHLDYENTASIYNDIEHNEISSNAEYGIHFNYSGYNNITHNDIWDNSDGIHIFSSSHNNISYNDIMDNGDGIFVVESGHSIITDNNITDNNNGVLLAGTGTNFTTVANNNVSSNSAYGIYISSSSDNDIIDNDITDYWRGIYVSSSSNNNIIGNEMPLGSDYGIWLEGSSNNDIVDNNVTSNSIGVYITTASSYNNITDNNALNNDYGIVLSSASNNNITDNNVTYCDSDGIFLESSWGNNIIGNNASNNSHSGIYLTASDGNDIIGNNASGNADSGINLTTSDSNDIIDNDVYLNAHCGIELDTSNYNTISNNTIWVTPPYWENVGNGISLRSSDHNTISGNNASYHQIGILLYSGSSYNDIIDNEAFENGEGIRLGVNCDYNNITDNRVILGYSSCIYLQGASYNTITGNYITRGNQGIGLIYASEHNTISYNEVVRTGAGIETYESSYNDIEHNKITRTGINIIGSSNTNVQYNNMTGRPFGGGISIMSSNFPGSQNQIRNNNITNGGGIFIMGSGLIGPNNNWIVNNRITNCSKGVHLWGFLMSPPPFNNYVIDNALLNNSVGIHMETTQSNTLINNTMTSCGIVIEGESVDFWDTHVIDTNNTVNGKPVYYWENVVGGTIPSGAGEVILADCTDATIENQELTWGSVGIELGYTSGIKIDNVNVSGNSWAGMYLWESSTANIANSEVASTGNNGIQINYGNGNNIQNTTFMNNSKDISLTDSDENDIVDNFINNSGGIHISFSDRTDILNNNISHSSYGLYLIGSHEDNIIGNNISYSNYGLYLQGSRENNIMDNNISHNERGIYMLNSNENDIIQNQVYSNSIYGFNLSNSRNNLIYHNNIIGNGNQSIDDGNSTRWNASYPTGGNYWSDYGGMDLNRTPSQDVPPPDGIGDTPYNIDPDSKDCYPLMDPLVPSNSPPSEPRNLATSSGDSYINLSWDPPLSLGGLPLIGYYIYRNTTSGNGEFYAEVGDILFFNDTGAINGIRYYYNVSAVNLMGEGPLSMEVNATPVTHPYAPQDLAAIGEATYVNLTWSPPISDGGSPITNYTIYRDVTPDPTAVYAVIGNVTWYNDTNVTGGVVYYYRVSAVTAIGEGALSNEDSAMPLSAPYAPTGLSTTSGDGFVNLSWIAPSNEGGSPITWYHIYRDGLLFHTVPSTQLWYNDTGVANGATYNYNVSASNSIGEGSKSSGVDATPLGRPSAPLNLLAHEGYRYVNLSWDAPSSDGGSTVLGYNIYRNGTSGIYDSVNQWWYNDTAVINGITYFYDIAAVNIVGEGSLSMINGTPGVPPSAPQNLQAITGDSYVYLAWDVPSDNGGFAVIVYYIYRNGIFIATAPGDQPWYNDTSAVNGVTYTYHVSAINSVGEGPRAGPVSRTPMTTPGAPQNLQAAASSTFVNLTWDAPANNGGDPVILYTVYRDGFYHATIISGHAFNDTNVTKGTTYAYTVSANNSLGEGSQSYPVDATPPTTKPSAPQNLQAEAGDGYVKLMWDPPLDTGGLAITEYYIYRDTTKLFTVSSDQPWYNDTDVINGINYKYNVSANNSIGEGPLSVGTNATPESPPPTENQPPSGIIGSPLTGAVLTGTVTISGTSSDPEGIVQRVDIKIDDGNWTQVTGNISWSYPWDTTTVPNGGHTISIRAYDGTTYSSETSIPVVVDNPSETAEPSGEFPFQLLLAVVLIIIILLLIVLLLTRKRKGPEEEPIEEEAGPEDREEEAAPDAEEEDATTEMEEETEAPEKTPPPKEVVWEEDIDEEPPKKLPPPPPPRKSKGIRVESDNEGIKDDKPGKETGMIEESEEEK